MDLIEILPLARADLPLEVFKDHLRLGTGFSDDGAQDAILDSCLRAAMGAIESRTKRVLLSRQFSWSLATWRREAGAQALPVSNVTGILALRMYRADGTSVEVDPARYTLLKDSQRPRIAPVGLGIPEISTHGWAEIMFEAGYSDWAALPGDLQQAMLMLAAHFYENRDMLVSGGGQIPFGVASLIEPYRRMRIGSAA